LAGLVGKFEGKRQRVDPGVSGCIILKLIFKGRGDGEAWTGLIWLRIGTGGGHL